MVVDCVVLSAHISNCDSGITPTNTLEKSWERVHDGDPGTR